MTNWLFYRIYLKYLLLNNPLSLDFNIATTRYYFNHFIEKGHKINSSHIYMLKLRRRYTPQTMLYTRILNKNTSKNIKRDLFTQADITPNNDIHPIDLYYLLKVPFYRYDSLTQVRIINTLLYYHNKSVLEVIRKPIYKFTYYITTGLNSSNFELNSKEITNA